MNFIIRFAALLAFSGVIISALSLAAHAQGTQTESHAAVIWINSRYGPNNSGIGLCGRYSGLGLGATVFDFPGDTTSGLPIRPGMIGISVDVYAVVDFNNWLAMYANTGLVGRLGTYRTSEEVRRNAQPHDMLSVGGGFQISLAAHLMLGIGYNGILDIPDYQGGPTYNTIHSVVAQVGYRL
ncbi:MAG: hypothetical protein JST22_02800 [Bacteroidetes bacterium]|nr:hypothetical protein [Bacteroidota bacterium]